MKRKPMNQPIVDNFSCNWPAEWREQDIGFFGYAHNGHLVRTFEFWNTEVVCARALKPLPSSRTSP